MQKLDFFREVQNETRSRSGIWAKFCFFTQKQVFGPRTAKSQLIGIKFCIHLLFYRIHLWADLDRDRRVGGSPLQAKPERLCFCNTYSKSYIEMTDRRDFGGKPSKWRWGRVLSWKILEFYSWAEPAPQNSTFRVFIVPLDYPAHSLQLETVLSQTNGTVESRDS